MWDVSVSLRVGCRGCVMTTIVKVRLTACAMAAIDSAKPPLSTVLLCFVRHGRKLHSNTCTGRHVRHQFDPPLNDPGIHKAAKQLICALRHEIKEHGDLPPRYRLVHSPYIRAKQTADALTRIENFAEVTLDGRVGEYLGNQRAVYDTFTDDRVARRYFASECYKALLNGNLPLDDSWSEMKLRACDFLQRQYSAGIALATKNACQSNLPPYLCDVCIHVTHGVILNTMFQFATSLVGATETKPPFNYMDAFILRISLDESYATHLGLTVVTDGHSHSVPSARRAGGSGCRAHPVPGNTKR